MSKTTIINKVKELFSTEEEMMFVDVKTEDGKILRLDDLSPESKCMEITEDGEVECPDGEYKLEDGMTLVVEGGLIKEMIETEETEEEVEETTEEMSVEESVEETVEETTEESVEEEIFEEEVVEAKEEEEEEEEEEEAKYATCEELEALKEELESIKTALGMVEEEKEEAYKALNELKEEFSTFKGEPSESPLTKKYEFKSLSRDEKLKMLRK